MNDLSDLKALAQQQGKIIDTLLHQLAIMQQNNMKLLQQIGNNELLSNESQHNIGINEANNTGVLDEIGNSELNNTNLLHEIGKKEMNITNEVQHIGKIELNTANTIKLKNEIRNLFHTNTKKKSINSTANVILYLHNQQVATRSELTKAARLSASGFAKHFLRLRNKDLVKRKSWKEYVLTEKSKAIVYRVFKQ